MQAVRWRLCLGALGLALVLPASASASISTVFGTITCQVSASGATAGQRWCSDGPGKTSITPSWDGTPIDVAVAFPPASGTDRNWPVVGIFHGWGGAKLEPWNFEAQRWLTQGYAVFSMTDRGWFGTCGGPSLSALKSGACARGYVHLMANAYEVRDAQYLLGELADERLINPQQIGATGASYGGGMSVQLGALKDRVMLPDHTLIPWRSPRYRIPMRIAATAPEVPWADLLQALMPNGSSLDYVADAPYLGPLGDHAVGIEKSLWVGTLFGLAFSSAYVDPLADGDPSANLQGWYGLDNTGGPYAGQALAAQQLAELPYHSAYYTDLSEPPAPALLSSGWNDDLFPVDETVRYYNKVRSAYPTAAIKLFYLDAGHSRSGADAPDQARLALAEDAWFNYYVRAQGSQPSKAQGGVTAFTSVCPAGNGGTEYDAPNWASLAQGEIRLDSAAQQQVTSPGVAPANSFTSGTVCATQPDANNPSAAEYSLPAAPASFTIAGSPTVIADISAPGANDQLIARLYDDDLSAGTEQLIGRAIYRPLDPGGGFTRQVFQLHPQAWQVQAGHALKLELLSSDSPYARNSSSPDSIQVKNLELRIPTIDPPGSVGGLVQSPLPRYLPPGYKLAEDFMTTVPGVPQLTGGSAVNATGQFTLGWSPSDPAADLQYTLQQQDASGSGWSDVSSSVTGPQFSFGSGSPESEGTWTYRVDAHQADGSVPTDFSAPSTTVKVDLTPPSAPTLTPDRAPDYPGGGGWYRDSVTVSATANGDPNLRDGSSGSGVNPSSIPSPSTYSTTGVSIDTATVKDNAGNQSAPTSLTVQVDATPPSLSVTCPPTVALDSLVNATVTASDSGSGLAVDPSGNVPINASSPGPQTTTETATDNVGHSVSRSCMTQVASGRTVFTSTVPASISNDDSPEILGFAQAGSTVNLYTNPACTGAPIATGSASTFASPGIQVTVPLNASTTLHATATGAGGTSACSADSITYVEDSTPPNISIGSQPPSRTNSTGASISFSANESSTFQCKLDTGSFASCTSPQSYTGLAAGQHTFQVRATDLAGNTSAPVSLPWTVDLSAPTISILLPASGAAFSMGQVVGAAYSCSDPDGPGDVARCTGTVAAGSPLDTTTIGLHSLVVGAVDQAGNPALASKGYTVYAADGSGTLGVTPRAVSALASHQTLTLTYTAAPGGMSNGSVSVLVPAGWSAPSTTTTAPGYTTASKGSVSTAGQTITVSGLTLLAGRAVKITYGSRAGGGPGANAPSSPAGAQAWQGQEQSVAGSTLTSLASSPLLTVYAADGSGSLTTATTSVVRATATTITLTYTVAGGGISMGELTLAVPSGWSAPSTISTAAGYTKVSRGRLSVAGQTIAVSGLTRSAGQTITITYGSRSAGGPGAFAPSTPVGSQTWQAQEKSVATGVLTNLANPPQITVG